MSLAAALQEKFPVRRQNSGQRKVARGGGLDGPPSHVAIVAAGLRGKVSAHSSGEQRLPHGCHVWQIC